jgi:hypothetical protein
MLPPGLTAHLAERVDQLLLRALHPSAQTVVRLVVGDCACDLVHSRDLDPREDERHLRARWRRAAGTRDALLAVIERHRRGRGLRPPVGGWPRALAAFVAEHARNAGETLYLLRYSGTPSTPDRPMHHLTAAEVLARSDAWLEEQVPMMVSP